jgi:hypothetical protein
MSLADIRRTAQTFQTTIGRRNAREYLFAVAGSIAFLAMMWILPGLVTKIGCAMTLLAIYFVVYQLHRDGSARVVPVDVAAGDCLAFHRGKLERQRDLLRRVGPWQLGPMVPGLGLFFAGLWLRNVNDRGDVLAMTITGLLMAAVLVVVYWLNIRAANELQRELDLLPE